MQRNHTLGKDKLLEELGSFLTPVLEDTYAFTSQIYINMLDVYEYFQKII